MTWIDKILPIVALILGWGLAQFGKFWTHRNTDRKKIKKLLFHLLELRWLLKREYDLNNEIDMYVDRMKCKLIEEFGEEVMGNNADQ